MGKCEPHCCTRKGGKRNRAEEGKRKREKHFQEFFIPRLWRNFELFAAGAASGEDREEVNEIPTKLLFTDNQHAVTDAAQVEILVADFAVAQIAFNNF